MKKKTPAQVKNLMGRAFAHLLDPPPTPAEEARLREHFGHRCAYCTAEAPPRHAHLDHARPRGGNGVRNLVLACRICNGDEKREMDWEAFLAMKCAADPAAHAERRERIVRWLDATDDPRATPPPELVALRESAEAEARAAFDAAYGRVREAVASWRRSRLSE